MSYASYDIRNYKYYGLAGSILLLVGSFDGVAGHFSKKYFVNHFKLHPLSVKINTFIKVYSRCVY